jgi:hypothetical protein
MLLPVCWSPAAAWGQGFDTEGTEGTKIAEKDYTEQRGNLMLMNFNSALLKDPPAAVRHIEISQ